MNPKPLLCAIALTGLAVTATPAAADPPMTLTSTAMPDGSTITPAQLLPLCGGQDQSPDLTWTNAPAATASYAITMFDPDAPFGGAWHWVAFDIAPTTTTLPESLPPATPLAHQATNAGFQPHYDGPCPPPGSPHHYTVTLYALDTPTLGLPDGVDNTTARAAITAHTLSTAQLTAHYPA